MAIKFKITPERIAEACNITEYLLLSAGSKEAALRVAPRFGLNDNGEYIVKVNIDDDGDIQSFDELRAAFGKLASVTPKRMEKLAAEFTEAVKQIVNPQNAEA